MGRALGASKVHTFSGPFDDKITRLEFKFGKYKFEDWEVHEKLMQFKQKFRDAGIENVQLKPKSGGRVNVEFSSEAYSRTSV